MDTTIPNVAPEKTLKILSVVVPPKLGHEARCAAAHAGLSLSRYVRRLIEAALASEVATVNATKPVAVAPSSDDALVVAAE